MSHNPAPTPATIENSALDSVEAAKAKQNSLRERLAARRQLLASVTHSTKTSSAALLTNNSSTGFGSINKPFNVNQSTVSVIENALKRKLSDNNITSVSSDTLSVYSQSNITSLSGLLNPSSNNCDHIGKCSCDKSQNASNVDVKQSDHSYNSLDKSSDVEKSTPKQSSIQQSKTSEAIPIDCEQKPNFSNIKRQCENNESISDRNKRLINDKCNHHQSTIKETNHEIEFDLENLLGAETTREKESKRIREEVMELLNRQSTKERFLTERFRTQGGSQVQQFCSYGTRTECSKVKARTGDKKRCTKLHFRKIIHPHTDESLGDCSFLNTCFHVDTCKYVHYTIDYTDSVNQQLNGGVANRNVLNNKKNRQTDNSSTTNIVSSSSSSVSSSQINTSSINSIDDGVSGGGAVKDNGTSLILYPPQWINCDIRLINMSILGKFAVIMADPPWDIHMELPYGTMSDDEMRRLDIPCLQDDGYIFLWVTGRAMELGRECLRLWGYERVDEVIWVKTNQLQRLIRTGRTGHWLNHGKEHCLVGVKGNPKGVNRGLDCDIIVSEVRETSHKPDEIYGIIERLSPGTRKLELFGRPHNLQPNWITLGNQLDGTYLVDPAVVERFKKHYPNGLDIKVK
ncbi:unnamed protein product [Schistosoma rodhaini]|uniref:mRNA m(6)A methyltransferase n=1 Tax=Schistosoma rodhaini TaxID=6188 RepID=A0AA85GB87_9TREM|nr:unnamed protein product [Schistosoma rodhaini]